MSMISRDEIQSLIQSSGEPPCVSIFMPTLRTGDTQQNPIRFKNLLRAAEEGLEQWGLRDGEATTLLAPARRLMDDRIFWGHLDDGLALFRSPAVFKTYRLPLELRELSVVEDRFHLKPLFSLLMEDGHYYVLALSLKSIRLILATRHEAREIDLGDAGDLAKSFREVMSGLTRRFALESPAGPGAVGRSRIYPRHSIGEDDLKAEIREYFQVVDDGLADPALDIDRQAPFVLAGVEYLLPRFREASRLPHILDEGLTGNPDDLSAEELRDKAWDIVEPVLLAARRRAAERCVELLGTGRASAQLEEILPAACDGRVDTLFTARGVRVWGTYDPGERRVEPQVDQQSQAPGSEDLLDRAAVETFQRGGTVYAVERQDVPGGYALAAIFRY